MLFLRVIIINLFIFCTLLVTLEMSAKVILFLKDISLSKFFFNKTNKSTASIESSFPEDMNVMRLADFPLVKLHQNYNSQNYNISKSGFRGGQTDFELLRHEHKYIFLSPQNKDVDYIFLGGSTTFGTGTTDKETVSELFKKINPEKNILNLGLSGNNLEGSINVLEEFLRSNKAPQKIIFLDGINEDWCFFNEPEKVNIDWVNLKTVNNPLISRYSVEIIINLAIKKLKFKNEKENREKKIKGEF